MNDQTTERSAGLQSCDKDQKIIFRFRRNLHRAIHRRVEEFGWTATDEHVRLVKGLFIWKTFNVETSRALELISLKEAIMCVRNFQKATAKKWIELRYEKEKKLLDWNKWNLSTDKQRGKIKRICFYVIKMNNDAVNTYLEETIGRRCMINQTSVNEANQLIRRLEQWEAKILLKK